MTASTSPATHEARRLLENRERLRHPNMQAFLKAIALAEGGDYDFRYGAVRGRRNDPWRFSDYSRTCRHYPMIQNRNSWGTSSLA